MIKIITIGRMVSFFITLISTIPLLIHYLMHTEPKHQMIVHIHVWFGCAFFIFAIASMIAQKKNKKSGKTT